MSNILNKAKGQAEKLQNAIYYRIASNKKHEQDVTQEFHELMYAANSYGKAWGSATWLGVPCRKLPFDLWMYQEIISKIKPDLIIETGTYKGGSALYLASMCDLINKGQIITVDVVRHPNLPKHKRITYLQGSSAAPEIINKLKEKAIGKQTVLVILDSDHRAEHVKKELEKYSPLVTKDSYLIVEDTNINGHPVEPKFGPGPMEALQDFLKANKNFITDKSQEKFFLSFNPSGYLKRIK